ncbi:MAG: type IV toxin-antitoxin system AbiEi family antitoxin domain-containing protein [Candidatus Methanodesulfokora sp.]
MHLHEIREALESSGRLVFDVKQISVLLGVPRSHAKVYAARLVSKNWAWRPRRGIIALTEDEFVLATQLVEPSYISMHSALYLHGILDQVPAFIECITTRQSLNLREIGIRYRRISPVIFFGYSRLDRQKSYVHVAAPEKAVLDMVYFGYQPPNDVELDLNMLRRMADRFSLLDSPRARRVARWVRKLAD